MKSHTLISEKVISSFRIALEVCSMEMARLRSSGCTYATQTLLFFLSLFIFAARSFERKMISISCYLIQKGAQWFLPSAREAAFRTKDSHVSPKAFYTLCNFDPYKIIPDLYDNMEYQIKFSVAEHTLWDDHPKFRTRSENFQKLSLVVWPWQQRSLNLSHSTTKVISPNVLLWLGQPKIIHRIPGLKKMKMCYYLC